MTSDLKTQLDVLILRVEKQQAALGLNDSQFVARYQRALGSTRTWRERLCARAFADLNPEKWLKRLTALVAELDGGSKAEAFYETLPFVRHATAQYHLLVGQRNDRRVMVVLGVTGVGKTVWARRTVAASPRDAVYVRANESWRDSKAQIARGLARALGAREEQSAAAGLNAVIEFLRATPVTVFLDEAHEGGVMLLKVVKTLVDETPARFVLLAYPTQWDRMLCADVGSYAEAQQVFGRTLKPVLDRWRHGLTRDDVAAYLRAAAGLDGEARPLAERVLPLVKRNGNFRLLADALDEAQAQADDTDAKLDAELIAQHIAALCPTPKGDPR